MSDPAKKFDEAVHFLRKAYTPNSTTNYEYIEGFMRDAAKEYATSQVREAQNELFERFNRMKRTLIINRSSSHCGNCGVDADPYEKRHDTKLGYGAQNGEAGCHHFWQYVTSEYSNMRKSCLEMRPDLVWLDDELENIKQRRIEITATHAKEEADHEGD